MSIVLFAIIGVLIEAGAGYWICYSAFCVGKFFKLIYEIIKEDAVL